jgi:signal transduction histidine kinase
VNVPHLSRPVFAEVDSKGKLLWADEALSLLNQRAGGIEGGALAVPAIAKLVRLSLNLQMKLSRAVKVADYEEKLELWIEVYPSPKVAKVAIVSWRTLADQKHGGHKSSRPFESINNNLIFDTQLRLLSAKGDVSHGLATTDFGKDGCAILASIMENGDSLNVLLNALSLGSSIENAQIRRRIDGRLFDVWGEQLVDEQQRAVGFRLSFVSHGEETLAIPALAPVGGALFGKNLAPVLRQPLGRIIANAETIGGELQGPIRENYALYARDIANAARHLSALVDDLGDLEAVERPDFRTARDEIELGDVARRVAGLLALKAADHRIVIHTPTDASKVTAIAEFRRTLQILLNLVNNAIRYSPDGTVISIETETADRFAVVTVSDQGRGISIEDRDKIFEKFERLGRSGDGGSGLGLYISRRLARAMGGELSVTNSDDGGAKFVLRLPNS